MTHVGVLFYDLEFIVIEYIYTIMINVIAFTKCGNIRDVQKMFDKMLEKKCTRYQQRKPKESSAPTH